MLSLFFHTSRYIIVELIVLQSGYSHLFSFLLNSLFSVSNYLLYIVLLLAFLLLLFVHLTFLVFI